MTVRSTVDGVASAELDEVVEQMANRPDWVRVPVRVGSTRAEVVVRTFSLEEIRREWQRRRGY